MNRSYLSILKHLMVIEVIQGLNPAQSGCRNCMWHQLWDTEKHRQCAQILWILFRINNMYVMSKRAQYGVIGLKLAGLKWS